MKRCRIADKTSKYSSAGWYEYEVDVDWLEEPKITVEDIRMVG